MSAKEIKDITKKLESYDKRYPKIFSSARTYLEKGRCFDIGHTVDALQVLLDLFEKDADLKAKHNVLIPALIFHDCGWCRVPKDILKGSYGDVKAENSGKIMHQKEGATIAKEILAKVGYDLKLIDEISYVVSIHDNPEECRKHENAKIVAEIDKLVRFMPCLFFGLIRDGTQTFEERVRFLERGLDTWFTISGFREKAAALLLERKK